MATMFKRGHKFDIMDLFCISTSEVQELFLKEFHSKVDKQKPNLDNLKVMLESGLVDANARDEDGWTPLHEAALRNSLAVAELLISSGADLNAKDNGDWTPLHSAAYWDSQAVAEFLISSGAEVNARTNDGQTPLHWAARWNSLAIAELLISSGAKVNARTNDGMTPFDWARSQAMGELLKSKK